VNESSTRNTGPTSKTRPKSAQMAICLYSCGDCARHGGRPLSVEAEHGGAALAASPNELRAVDLHKGLAQHELPEQLQE